jgi:molybdopterin synthase sulfur carrier subunit
MGFAGVYSANPILIIFKSDYTMQVTVKLYATLRRYSKAENINDSFDIELKDGAIVNDLVEAVGIPTEEVKLTFINGRVQEPDWILQPGDQVGIFPPIGGGTND